MITLTRDRDAYFVIRGFYYQVERTIEHWLRLNSGEILQLEAGEDIDRLTRTLVNGTWRDECELEQIKHRDKNISLRDGCEPLANFAEHRQTNPNFKHLRFRFATNAQPGVERPCVMQAERPKGTLKRAGIALWCAASNGQQLGNEKSSVLEALKDFLIGCSQPTEVPEETWDIFQKFLSDATDTQWQDFVSRFEWETGLTKPMDLSSSIERDLLDRKAVTTSEEAHSFYLGLFFHVFSILSSKGVKQLEADDWRQVGQQPLSVAGRALMDKLNTEVRELAVRVELVEERVNVVEVEVKALASDLTLETMATRQHLGHHEAMLDAGFAENRESHDFNSKLLLELHAKLDKKKDELTPEELEKSPIAQGWRLEIRLEEIRPLITKGKVNAAKEQLETLRPQIENLVEVETRSRLLARLFGQIASCEWRLSNYETTAKLYQQAVDLQPDNIEIIISAGFGALLNGDATAALRYGSDALKRDPENGGALTVVVRSLRLLQRSDEIAPLLKAHAKAAETPQLLLNLGSSAIEDGDFAEAQKYGEKSCELEPNNPNCHRLLSDAFYMPIRQQLRTDPPLMLRFSDEQLSQLQLAEASMTTAINLSEGWDACELRMGMFCNRACIREFLGRIDGKDGALSDCEEGLKQAPNEPALLLTKGEILLNHKSDPGAALTYFKRVLERQKKSGDDHFGEDAAVLCAEAHTYLREWTKVVSVLQPLYRPESGQRDQIDLARLLCVAAFHLSDQALIDSIQSDLKTNYPNDPSALAIEANLALDRQDYPLHRDLMQKVYDLSTGEHRNRAAFLLARAHQYNSEFDQAITLLRPLLNWSRIDRDNPDLIVISLLQALRFGGYKQQAHELAVRVRGGERAVNNVSEYEADHCVDEGNSDHAIELFKQLSEDNPQNIQYARNLAALCLSHAPSLLKEQAPGGIALSPEAIETARTALRRVNIEDLKGDAQQMMDLARLRQKAGFGDAPDWAYRALHLALDDKGVAEDYLFYMLTEVNLGDSHFTHEVVSHDSAVELKRRGKSTTWVLTQHPTGDSRELSVDGPFARKLMGKKVGDKIAGADNDLPDNEDHTIVSICSKYQHAMQQTNHKVESGILPSNRMVIGHFPPPLGSVEHVKIEREALQEKLDAGSTWATLYRDWSVALNTVAQATGRTLPELWRSASTNGGYDVAPSGHFYNCAATLVHVAAQKQMLKVAKVFVLDWTAIITIVHLGLETEIEQQFPRLLVALEVMEEAREFYRNQQRGDADYEEDNLLDERRRAFAQRLWTWLQGREIVPAGIWTETEIEQAKLYGSATVATLKIARDQDLPLWADDLRLRGLSYNLHQTKAVGTQAVLDHLRGQGAISREVEYEALLRLLKANYGHFWWTNEFSSWLLKRDDAKASREKRRAFRTLAFWDISDAEAITRAAQALVQIYQMSLLYERRQALCTIVLDALVEGRNTNSASLALVEYLQKSFDQAPLLLETLSEIIGEWGRCKIQVVP